MIVKLHHEDLARIRACLMTSHPDRGELAYCFAVLDKVLGGTPAPLKLGSTPPAPQRPATARAAIPATIDASEAAEDAALIAELARIDAAEAADDPHGLNRGVDGLL